MHKITLARVHVLGHIFSRGDVAVGHGLAGQDAEAVGGTDAVAGYADGID